MYEEELNFYAIKNCLVNKDVQIDFTKLIKYIKFATFVPNKYLNF